MSKNKEKIKYQIQIPVLHFVCVERDEELKDEELWKTVTEEEIVESVFQDKVESEAIYSWKNLESKELVFSK